MDAGALVRQIVVVGFHGNSLSILDTKVEEEHSKVANWASSIVVADAVGAEEKVDKIQKVMGVVLGKSFDP